MTNDKPTLDSVVAKVENILRLRCAVQNAAETVATASRELAKYRVDLIAHEASLAEAMGAEIEWTPVAQLPPRKWLRTKRVPYPNAKRGDVVWVGRRKILGVLQEIHDGKARVKYNGKICKCDPKDLWHPYPGEPLPLASGDK